MSVTRVNVEFAKRIFADRVGNSYEYGGNWDPYDIAVGTDCSGLVIDICDAVRNGTAMAWSRHGMSTESWRPIEVGQTGTIFNTVCVAHPSDFPADAAVKIALHHGPGGGANSHMWCEVEGIRMESNGSDGCVTGDQARSVYDTAFANDWHFIPGPIDGAAPAPPPPEAPVSTFFADVSYFQAPVDDSYPHPVLSIRSNDGTFRDTNFGHNYQWCVNAVESGRLAFFIVYFYWRPGSGDVDTHMDMVASQGGPHPKMVTMIDLESGGNPGGDQSGELNGEYSRLAGWLGDPRRVIAYANRGDYGMWRSQPDGLRWVGAGYGQNPNLPGQVAHQYTDGSAGANQGLPLGAPPFGNCDMNVADNLDPHQFAAACGIGTDTGGFLMALTDDEQRELLDKTREVWNQLRGVDGHGWKQLGQDANGNDLTLVDAIAALKKKSGA